MRSFEVRPIGKVESPLTDLASAPRQADEGAPEAWLVFEPNCSRVSGTSAPATRSSSLVRVGHLEALDGTPIIDVKPVLNEDIGHR